MSEWISVEDRLPSEEEDFDALCVDKYSRSYCAAKWIDGNNWECHESGQLLFWTPTHWMPLPEPPRE